MRTCLDGHIPGWTPTWLRGVINQGHGNATGRTIQIYENDEINRPAVRAILSEIVAHNRRGWRRLSTS